MSTQHASLYRPWGPDADTPAPWVVEDTDTHVIVLDAQGGLIADCTNGFDGDDGWVMSASCGPIAKLIGAAPDLLKALELAIFYADKRGAMPTAGQWDVLDKKFREAIAKATQA